MPVLSGWANNCGIELFTIGWVQCPADLEIGDGGHAREPHGAYIPGLQGVKGGPRTKLRRLALLALIAIQAYYD
jgi:hypothetical protein